MTASPTSTNKTLLIVDDDAIARAGLTTLLASISTEPIFSLELGRTLRNRRGIPPRRLAISITEGHNRTVLPVRPLPATYGVISQQLPDFKRFAFLRTSQNYTRPNDILWFVTMNDTKTSPDLVSRSVPIQFYFEGK